MWWKTVERHMKQREEAVLKVARKSIGGSFIFHQSTNLFILYWFYIICQWLFNLTQQFCIEEGLWETNYFPFVGRVLNHDSEVMTKQNKWHWIQNHVVIHLLLNDNSMHAKKKRDRLSPAQTGILIQFLWLSKSFFCHRALHTEEISHWHCGHSRQKVSIARGHREKCYFYFIKCFVCFKGQTKNNQHWEFWYGEVQWVIQYELCVPLIKGWNPKYALCVNTDTSREKRWRHPEGEKGQWEHPEIKNWRIPQTDRNTAN